MLIFERQAADSLAEALSYGQLSVVLFLRSYRQPNFYDRLLRDAGLCDVQTMSIPLETAFVLLSGRKP